MGLFSKKNRGNSSLATIDTPPLIQEEEPVNYDSVLYYLIGLSQKEFDRLNKVAVVYRNADKEAAKILEVKNEPTTTLKSPEPLTDDEVDKALDDTLAAAFIETPIEPIKPKQSEVKDKNEDGK